MIHTLSIQLVDREEALTLRALIEELGYRVSLTHELGTSSSVPCRETRLGKLVLRHFASNPSRTFLEEDIAILCEENDYKGSSASPTLFKLFRDGDIAKLSPGLYRHKEK